MNIRITSVLVAILLSITCDAQQFRRLKVGTGLGLARPAGKGSKKGLLIYFEPAYRVTDRIAVGLRVEGAIMGRTAVLANTSAVTVEAKISANASYTVNGQYYFSDKLFRPFVGAGFGVYKLASIKLASTASNPNSGAASSEISGASEWGYYPRIGFDFTHFVFQLEYNIIPKTKATVVITDSSGNTTTITSVTQNNYLGVKLGLFLGGGRKRSNVSK